MPVVTVTNDPLTAVYSAPAYNQLYRPLTIVNYDPSNPVFYSDSPGSITSKSSFIPAGSFEVFDGKLDVWCSTLDDSVSVLIDVKYGTTLASSVTTLQPSSSPPNFYSAAIGSGGTVDLIGGSGFPKGGKFAIQMISACMSSTAATVGAGLGSAFATEDIIQDSTGVPVMQNEIGMGQGEQGSVTSGNSLDLSQCVIPAGRKLQLVNGGAGGSGILRRCSATVVFYLVADPGE